MELPKNITQIGETNNHCKVYVEDYVVSYMKQLNALAQDKEMAVALYGHRKEDGGVTYLFLYGAAEMDSIRRETRHLSQAQKQEIEKMRKRYFEEYIFLGYRLLNGEMVEGFHIFEQEICRYIKGYAQFYEKNDSMLAYMLDARKEEIKPEVVEQEKYEVVKRRQEERRTAEAEDNKETRSYRQNRENIEVNNGYRENKISQYRNKQENIKQNTGSMTNFKKIKVSVVASFAILCVCGLVMMSMEEGAEDIQVAVRQIMKGMTEQKLPDAVAVANQEVQTDILMTQDRLTEALEQENQILPSQMPGEVGLATSAPAGTASPTAVPGITPTAEPIAESTPLPGQDANIIQEPVPTPVPEKMEEAQTVAEVSPTEYVIEDGDTLIDISIKNYGNDGVVQEICALNKINNPDDIKVGQKILLP